MGATQEQMKELQDKVSFLIEDRFGGDYHKAFDHYDAEVKDGNINRAELMNFLGDAEVGNWLTRGLWADRIIAELDADGDGQISEAEFGDALRGPNTVLPVSPDRVEDERKVV